MKASEAKALTELALKDLGLLETEKLIEILKQIEHQARQGKSMLECSGNLSEGLCKELEDLGYDITQDDETSLIIGWY